MSSEGKGVIQTNRAFRQFANLCREMRLLITERPIDISEPGVVESAGWQYMQSLKLPMLNDNEQQFIKQRRHLASSNAVQNRKSYHT